VAEVILLSFYLLLILKIVFCLWTPVTLLLLHARLCYCTQCENTCDLLQVMLLDEPPFEVLYTVKEQPVKNKTPKETKVKNITFIPVPDSGEKTSDFYTYPRLHVACPLDCLHCMHFSAKCSASLFSYITL